MTTSGGTRTSFCAWSWLSRVLGRVAEGVIALLYPPECVACGRPLSNPGILCSVCAASLEEPSGRRCAVCGTDLDDPALDLCLACGTRDRGFDHVVALGPYDALWGRLVRAFKFDREPAVGRWLGERLAEAAERDGMAEAVDWVTFVPMTNGERRARGFNQARTLAGHVARRLGLPLRRTLVKVRSTSDQAALSASVRRDNLRGAFRAIPSRNVRVLLIDDICTTGSTAEACARALRSEGAASVSVLVVARA